MPSVLQSVAGLIELDKLSGLLRGSKPRPLSAVADLPLYTIHW
jgi:hypothetical protein